MNVCPDCGNGFLQPFRCVSCGAQKLYDHTVTSQAETIAALRARVAELESMNKMLCGKLDDQRRALWDPCQPYLKDGETPAECIARNRRDVDIALSSLARDRARVAEARGLMDRTTQFLRADVGIGSEYTLLSEIEDWLHPSAGGG